jgi:NitT/TauT family transport system ATP-binding protein
MGQTKIRTRNLRLEYVDGQTGKCLVAIASLDLDVYEGELLCILGPSGCGKSTLLYLIAGLTQPTAGQIVVDGKRVMGPGADRGMVFQEYALLPWRNIRDNIGLGLKLRKASRDVREATVRRFVDLVGLAGFEDKFPHELSGGMRQRVAVARTLAADPEVVLMDEPFAAVDAQTRMTLQDELVRVWATTRKTIVFVTHSVEEAAFLADRVAVLTSRPGRVKEIVPIEVPRACRRMRGANAQLMAAEAWLLASVRAEVQTVEASS